MLRNTQYAVRTRPMWNVVGHERAIEVLTRSLCEGTYAHAYLFTGPEQVGKRTLALELAKALNCLTREPAGEGRNGAPCGTCRSCRRISEGKHSDVLLVEVETTADANRKAIGIDQVREIGRFVNLEPFEGRTRVVIIDGAETMTVQAANAFLKTLEEPPPAVVLVLLADHEESLLETVRSRCQRLALAPVPRQKIAAALVERWGASAEQAALLAGLARGRLGWAVAALQNDEVLAERARTLATIHRLAEADRNDRFAYAAELAVRFGQDRSAVFRVLELWREWWRDVFLVQVGAAEAITNRDDLAAIETVAVAHSPGEVIAVLEAVEKTVSYLHYNVNARLALEVFLLSLPAPAKREEAEVPLRRRSLAGRS